MKNNKKSACDECKDYPCKYKGKEADCKKWDDFNEAQNPAVSNWNPQGYIMVEADDMQYKLTCFDEGIRGNCGENCRVYQKGECNNATERFMAFKKNLRKRNNER